MEIPREQILRECDIIIKEYGVNGLIKHFIQEYIKHHLSHTPMKKNNYDIDPFGEENWDDEIRTDDDKECKFDLNSLPISVEILAKLNLKNKRLFIVEDLLPISWNRCRISFGANNLSREFYKQVLIRETISMINKQLEYSKIFKVRMMAQLLLINKAIDNCGYDELILKSRYLTDAYIGPNV